MTELPEHLKKLCDYAGWEYNKIKIVDGVPRCCDTCKHARDDGFNVRVCCTLEDIYWWRISSCFNYERKGEKMTGAELKKHRDKCKDCAHAQKCCGPFYLCTLRNYDRKHGNTNACMDYKRKETDK